jgi:hypothetical protein
MSLAEDVGISIDLQIGRSLVEDVGTRIELSVDATRLISLGSHSDDVRRSPKWTEMVLPFGFVYGFLDDLFEMVDDAFGAIAIRDLSSGTVLFDVLKA